MMLIGLESEIDEIIKYKEDKLKEMNDNYKNMSDKIGYILIFCAFIATALLIGVSSIKLVNNFKYQNDIKCYENYYLATETLLDSLGVDCDNSIFNTKVGRDYLIHKNKIDSIFHNFTNDEPFGIKEE